MSAPATPSTSPTKTPAAKPQSPFEHDAPVKVLRQWAVAVAKDINADDANFSRAAHYETAAGAKEMSTVVLKGALGRYYPGPVPFTPVAVKNTGDTSEVFLCMQDGGFSHASKTDPKTEKRDVINVKMTLVKSHQGLRIDSLYSDKGTDCSGVNIQEVTW